MAWSGWALGTAGPPVVAAKRVLRRKFSYASELDDSPTVTLPFLVVLAEYQRRKNADPNYGGRQLRTDGVLDWATQVALGIWQPPPPAERVVVFTVNGTGVGWDVGYPFDVGAAQDQSRIVLQPIGYPSAAFPMGPSAKAGEDELAKQMARHLDGNSQKFILIGYSQGAMITSRVLRRMMVGDLQGYLGRCIAGVTFGNPLREEHHFVGDVDPGGHGLDPNCLVDTPDWWRDYAIAGDIYTCGDGGRDAEAMEYMTAIYSTVQGNAVSGRDSLGEQLIELFMNPFRQAPSVMKAIASGIGFVAAHPPTAPHIEYHVRQCFPGVTHFDSAVAFVRDSVNAGARL